MSTPHIRYVLPSIGIFKVILTTQYHPYNNKKIMYYTLNVGGKYDKCVNITIPSEDDPNKEELKLSWAESEDKECSIDNNNIRGYATQRMMQLAFTVAKEIAPYAKYIVFDDRSTFKCDTPDGKQKISLPPYHIAFYGKTWYEDKFKARIKNEELYKEYRKLVNNLHNPLVKPKRFEFGNIDLMKILLPLYEKTETWSEFFKLIGKKYPKDKCTIMYPWILNAITDIFEGNTLFMNTTWVINIDDNPTIRYYELDPSEVDNKILKRVHGGTYKEDYFNWFYVNYNDTMNWNLKSFLKRNKYNMTRRNYKKNNKTRKQKELF